MVDRPEGRLGRADVAFLRWLDGGRRGLAPAPSPQLFELNLVESDHLGLPALTWEGAQAAMRLRLAPDDDVGGVAG